MIKGEEGWWLGIEISNPSAGGASDAGPSRGAGVAVGLWDGAGFARVEVEGLTAGRRHDDDLMPAVARVCERAGVRAAELVRIAVSVGPGGFTSLRVACATGQAIALATGAEVRAVPSWRSAMWGLEAGAPWGEGRALVGPVVVCLASKGESTHATVLEATSAGMTGSIGSGGVGSGGRAGHWRWRERVLGMVGAGEVMGERPRTVVADQHVPASVLKAASEAGAVVVGPGLSAAGVLWLGALDVEDGSFHVGGNEGGTVGGAVGGARDGDRGGLSDIESLRPWYSREPDAVTQWRARGGRGGGVGV